MGNYNGNVKFISIDGTDISTRFNQVSLTETVGEEDVTVGSGATHVQRAAKLASNAISMQIGYEAGAVPSYIQKLKAGPHRIIIGTEGNSAGMPKHEQDFIINSNQIQGMSVDKTEMYFEIGGNSADAPVVDLFDGGTF
jgi:hypothetical protein